jgi:hypothetical protein
VVTCIQSFLQFRHIKIFPFIAQSLGTYKVIQFSSLTKENPNPQPKIYNWCMGHRKSLLGQGSSLHDSVSQTDRNLWRLSAILRCCRMCQGTIWYIGGDGCEWHVAYIFRVYFILNMAATGSSETLVSICRLGGTASQFWTLHWRLISSHYVSNLTPFNLLTFWHRNVLIFLAHRVYKMWIIQEPKKVALCNKRHFEEQEMESVQHV